MKHAENTINSLLFEDLKAFTEGLKALSKRSGINFIHDNAKSPYQTLVYDSDNIEAAKRIYEKHIARMANALFTCIPLHNCEKFGIIKRAFSRRVPNMDGYYFNDELNILHDIFKQFTKMCKEDFSTHQKYIKLL